ncbi:sigma factor-like helix-turn-helix DNA-binding protein [Roseovarius sp. S4756]|uniref:sigma factor-like helix-turn-helix DNA-binding protein n=1 Tax=Roseovarius maritimus TaxID=3342637 RepID=UPI003729AAF7
MMTKSRQYADDAPHVDEGLDADRVRSALLEAMSGLDKREKYVLSKRVLQDYFVSLDAVADELGISRGRAGQIQREALDRLGCWYAGFFC